MRDAHPWIKNDFRLPEGEETPRTLCKGQPGRYCPTFAPTATKSTCRSPVGKVEIEKGGASTGVVAKRGIYTRKRTWMGNGRYDARGEGEPCVQFSRLMSRPM